MRNKLTDLNNLLFEQLERINDDELKGDALTAEISRSKAVTNVARTIVDNAKTMLDAAKFMDMAGYTSNTNALKLLGGGSEDE